jgi:hypothetical protein
VSIVPGLNSQNDVFVGKKREVHHQLKSRRRQTNVRASLTSLGGPSEPLKHPFSGVHRLTFLFPSNFSRQQQSLLKIRHAWDHTGCLV